MSANVGESDLMDNKKLDPGKKNYGGFCQTCDRFLSSVGRFCINAGGRDTERHRDMGDSYWPSLSRKFDLNISRYSTPASFVEGSLHLATAFWAVCRRFAKVRSVTLFKMSSLPLPTAEEMWGRRKKCRTIVTRAVGEPANRVPPGIFCGFYENVRGLM